MTEPLTTPRRVQEFETIDPINDENEWWKVLLVLPGEKLIGGVYASRQIADAVADVAKTIASVAGLEISAHVFDPIRHD